MSSYGLHGQLQEEGRQQALGFHPRRPSWMTWLVSLRVVGGKKKRKKKKAQSDDCTLAKTHRIEVSDEQKETGKGLTSGGDGPFPVSKMETVSSASPLRLILPATWTASGVRNCTIGRVHAHRRSVPRPITYPCLVVEQGVVH